MPNTPAPNRFASVKLPVGLVEQAREAAHTMRRSTASQIEYWATLGRALERAGLTASDSHALIAKEEAAEYRLAGKAEAAALSAELQALQGHVLALAQSGALATRARAAVTANRAKAAPRGKSRKAA